ncbi:methylmalonyl-CoA mutase subunit beta [Muricauda sp. 334s03]|uniref:Methylmalonyl-CoA mutase subunit beta n=1 Tax=Flagellimonas yonaguniensis TaxID=3031325 RepID=A0ABT5XXH0_9FLAO|nr:methylmalonyl-CoA mutase subunit beta [[Muricauda] yonaguniensis]MDF0715783.1 methylmalonyl-CoA mutase subunit beta [[Muricauda] yonaguniensis]
MNNTSLFHEFPEVSAKQWKQKIQMDLKGADYNETLVWESLEGINVKPFYNQEDLKNIPSYALPKNHDWAVGQSIYVGDEKKSNIKALEILEKGVETLIFTIPNEATDFETLFSGVDLKETKLYFNFEFLVLEPIKKLVTLLKDKKAKAYLNIDIIGHLTKDGNWYHNLEKDHKILAALVALGTSDISIIGVNASRYQNAGANMVQQLSYALAHANEYLNHFVTSGAVEKSFPITFKMAVGSNYFFEIAKIKAMRWLWNSLISEYGIQSECNILAVPSKRNKTLYDYNVNMLRTTSECMSAVLGGADTVSNLAYDAIYHKDNDFGERIARNQLLLLKEEGYFLEASQISEGAYYIESLTHQLAEKALVLFKHLEKAGGFLDTMKKGTIQQKIKESAEKEQQLFDEGKIVSLGTNRYQNPQDRMKDDLELYPFVKQKARKTIIEPIIEKRLAEASEQKRLNDE